MSHGLPKNLSTTYQRLKNGTDSIAGWLATTAEKLGYASEAKPKKSRKKKKAGNSGSQPSGGKTHTIATKDFTTLATFIAEKDEVEVPPKLAALLDQTISLRQWYSATVSSELEETADKLESDDRHAFFLGVLKKVQNTLRPRYAKGYVPSKTKAKTVEEVINMFEHLELEESSEAFEQAPNVVGPVLNSPASDVVYKAERPDSIQEDFFELVLLLHDLTKVRTEVNRAWEGHKQGLLDLIAVSITTNTAVDLARAMEADFNDTLQKYGGAPMMLDMYFAAACIEAGTSHNYKERPDDYFNFRMYDLAESIFYPSQRLLGAFCAAMPTQAGRTMEMKPGFYGTYNPSSDRSRKSVRDKLNEDKILLMEMLAEFTTYCYVVGPSPAEDEFTRGLRTMFKNKKFTLSLTFAATLFLDIHHILREEASSGYQTLGRVAHFTQDRIRQNFEFHQDLRIENWPRENDDVVRQFSDFITQWIVEDPHQKAAKRMKRQFMPAPFHLYKQHPWLCGLWKYYIQMQLHEISIVFVNAWGSIMSCAHLYNAIQGEKLNTSQWKDMDVAVALQGPENFFVGEPPNSPDDYLKRFAMAMGLSAAQLAKGGRKKKGLIKSKRGPHSMKELGAVLQTFKGRYCEMNGRTDLRTEDIQNIVEMSNWGYDMNENDQPDQLYKDSDVKPSNKAGQAKQLPVAKLLGLLRAMVHAEVIEISFDYLTHHRQCWRLLRAVKDCCRDKLIKMFGLSYIEKETELPFVVGYILMAATNTNQLGKWMKLDQSAKVSSALLKEAADVVEPLASCEAGAMIVETILPQILGVEIAFETE